MWKLVNAENRIYPIKSVENEQMNGRVLIDVPAPNKLLKKALKKVPVLRMATNAALQMDVGYNLSSYMGGLNTRLGHVGARAKINEEINVFWGQKLDVEAVFGAKIKLWDN